MFSGPYHRVNILRQQIAPQRVSAQERPKVCIVIGAGAGIGVNVAKRFAKGGFTAVLCRRSDGDGLQRAVKAIQEAGGSAHGFLMDMVKPGAIEDLIAKVEA